MTDERDRPVATPSQTVGPFFHLGLARDQRLGRLVSASATAHPLRLRIRVADGEGSPVPDALVEIWQSDADAGAAPVAASPDDIAARAFTGFGQLASNDEGCCEFETVKPRRLADGRGGLQAAHINVCLFARGLLRHLYTRVYFAGDDGLADDPVLALVPDDRRPTLIAQADPDQPTRWLFDVRLQGDAETVFFDL